MVDAVQSTFASHGPSDVLLGGALGLPLALVGSLAPGAESVQGRGRTASLGAPIGVDALLEPAFDFTAGWLVSPLKEAAGPLRAFEVEAMRVLFRAG